MFHIAPESEARGRELNQACVSLVPESMASNTPQLVLGPAETLQLFSRAVGAGIFFQASYHLLAAGHSGQEIRMIH